LKAQLKELASIILRSPSIARFVGQRRRIMLVSLCFHRFGDQHDNGDGHDLDELDESLRWLARSGFVFGDASETYRGLARGRFPDRPTVVVTVDDGYADLLSAIPIFSRHGCPVTVFLATDFLDRRAPLWWDQIQLLLSGASGGVSLDDVGGITWSANWDTVADRRRSGEELIELVKRSLEPTRYAVIEALAQISGLPVPAGQLSGYAPLAWDEVRSLEREGVRFGPHTHTHPILSAVDDAGARYEIFTSWSRIREETRYPLPVFAYPDGTPWSYTVRDRLLLQEAGIDVAVTMDARWMLPSAPPIDAYQIGRMAFPLRFADLQLSVLRLGRSLRHRHPSP